MTNNSSKLTQLEDLLLKELATSNGNILDNNSLLCTLQETRENALIIKSKLEECQCTKNIIEEVRESYKDVSQRGSSLYFASAGLSAINNMYELSLENFIEQFQIGLQNTEDNEDVSIRVKNLISSCSNRLYKFTCLGIFEQHRLTYSLNLAITILKEKDINMLETSMVAYFIKGSTAAGATNEDVPSCLNWLSSDSWNLLVQIAQYNIKFDQLKKCCTELKFLNWVQSSEPERSLPPLDSIFTKFELLCLVRIFRPDRCFNAIKLFIADSIGEEFVQSPTLDYEEVYNESSSRCPIILILSKGADPQSNLQNLGNQIGCKVAFVSLGQGQGKVANRMLGSAFRNGHWIVIQNCHLLLQWVHQLDTQLQHLGAPHSKFRLWLTTEPSPQFPVYLLQRSYKIVMEPPDGMRLNMQSTLINVNRSLIESCENPQIYPLLYSLTYLHAALQERKKFGKLGWNVPYDFNDSDFSISLQLFCAYLSRSSTEGIDGIPWESLKFLIGSAMYGGRVSDNMDRRVLQTYFNEYFGDFVLRGGQTFQFSKIHSTYILPSSTVPSRSKLESYKDNINMMPTNTRPAVLGLHYKAEAMYFSDRMDKTLSALAMTLTDIVEKKNVQLEHEENIAKVVEIIGSIPISNPETGPFDINRIREEVISRNEMKILTPYDIVLLQELDYWNQLCLCMYMTMNDLLQALQGERGMNDQIEHTLQLLNEGSLPAVWMKYCPPTTKKLSSWMIHFKQRSEQYVSWVESGQPQVIWLSGLHSPQGFLSALLQTVCRSKGWALDETVIHTEVTKWTHEDMMNGNISLDNKSSIFVRGLYLEGAAWDTENSKLTNESFNSDNNSLNTDLPLVRLVPMQKTSLSKHQNLLAVPVYLTRFRRGVNGEGLVFEAFLDTDIHHSFWILQGIAILMNLD
jgi:dynein heavy chain